MHIQTIPFLNEGQFNVNIVNFNFHVVSFAFHSVNKFLCWHYVYWYIFVPAFFSLKSLMVHICTKPIHPPNPIFSDFTLHSYKNDPLGEKNQLLFGYLSNKKKFDLKGLNAIFSIFAFLYIRRFAFGGQY